MKGGLPAPRGASGGGTQWFEEGFACCTWEKRGAFKMRGWDEQAGRGDLQRRLKSRAEGEYIRGKGSYLVSHGE